MKRSLIIALLSLIGFANIARAEQASGPGAGKRLEALKLFVATGDLADKEVEFIAERKEKPTVYVFVPAEKFSRPMARFVKALDEKLHAERTDIDIIVVWLTDDVTKVKERLPRVQESLKLNRTVWCVYLGEKTGPDTWGINPDADLTLVIADGLKSTVSRSYLSINETDTPKVFAELPAKK